MNSFLLRLKCNILSERKSGMEMVQVAILIGIAIAIGLLFREKIGDFLDGIFGELDANTFTKKY